MTVSVDGNQIQHFTGGIGQLLYESEDFTAVHTAFGKIHIKMSILNIGVFSVDREAVSVGISFLSLVIIDRGVDGDLFYPGRKGLNIFQGIQFLQYLQKARIHTFHGFVFIDGVSFTNPHHDRETIFIQQSLTFSVVMYASLYDQIRNQCIC